MKNSKMTMTKLAFITGYSERQTQNIVGGKVDAPLRFALTVYYLSGGEVDLSSMIREPDDFREGIRDFVNLTNARRSQTILDKYGRSMHEVRLL